MTTEVVLSGLSGDGEDRRYGSFRLGSKGIEVDPPGDPVLERILRKPIPVGGSDTWVRSDREPEAWLKALPLQYRSAYLQAWELPDSSSGNVSTRKSDIVAPRVAPTRQKSILDYGVKAIVSGYDSMGRRYCRDHGRSIPCGQAVSEEKDERKRGDVRSSAQRGTVSHGDTLGVGVRTGKPVRDPNGGPAGQVTPPNVAFGCDTSEAMTEVASADGWEVIRDHLLNLPDAPECQNLATEGISHDPQALAAELEAQVQAEGDSDVGLILNAMLDLLGENPEATEAMVEGGHLDTAGRDEEEQEPAEKIDLVTDILAGTFGEEELKEAAERDEAEEGTTQQPYPEKSLPNYFIKGRGEPCKRGEAASRTGCIPKVKPTPKRRNTQTTEQPPLQREPLQPPTLEPRQDAAVEQEPTAADASTPTPDELVEKRAKTKRKTPEEKKQQIADMVERINGLRNRHNHTAEDVTDLAKTLCDELTVRQLTDLKKALGGLPASGRDKKAYAKRIAERIFGRSAEASPTSPSPAPSMRGTAAPPEEPIAEAPPPAPEAQAPEPRVETFPHEQQEPEPVAEQSQQPSPEIGTAPTGEPVVDQEAIEPSQEEPAPEPAAEQQAPEPAPDEAVAEVENALPPETTEEQARDQQWADELRSSDRNVRNQAWSDFIEAHKKGLMGFVAKKIKNPADVENIMQEAYVSMLVGMDRYDPAKSSLRNYLFTIAFRRATDAMRKKGRSKEESGAGGDFGGEEGDVFSRTADTRTQAPDEIAAETETNQRRTAAVRRAADTISQQLRAKGREQDAEIWELAWNGGMKPAEIAAKLNVRAQAVSNVTMKARDRMKELLKKYAPKEFTDDQQ